MQGGSGDGSPRRPRLALLQMMRRTLRCSPKLARTLCCGEAEPLPENELILRLPQAELMAHQH
jgi:hypothetical protein